MIIVETSLPIQAIKENHNDFFNSMVKIVIDIEKELIALNAELHADLEALLLEQGSNQKHLWGANIYFENPYEIEFTSLINIRPAQGNKSMEVQDEKIKQKMLEIVKKLITI